MAIETSVQFPDEFAPDKVKRNKSYGLQYAKAIASLYLLPNGIFETRLSKYRLLRKYAEGTQSVQKYKDLLEIKEGETSYLNLDFTPPPIISKFLDIKIGQLSGKKYKITCTPINSNGKIAADKERDQLYANMVFKPVNDLVKQATGVSVIPLDAYTPDDEDELKLYLEMTFKSAVSMAMEEGIDFILYNNDWKQLEGRLIRDLLVLKTCCARTYFDHNGNIRIKYVDPERMVVPYSQNDTFSDMPYGAHMEEITIQNLAAMNKDLTEDDLKKIARENAGKWGNGVWNTMWDSYYPNNDTFDRKYNNFKVRMMDFEFLSTSVKNYVFTSKNGRLYSDKVEDDYSIEKDKKAKGEKEQITKRIKVRYEGKWIVGTDYLIDYKLSDNMQFEKFEDVYSPETELSFKFIMPNSFEMVNLSLTERMIPFADQIVLCHLKMQQVLGAIKPPGIAVDSSGLQDVIAGMGQGKNFKPSDLVKMYNQLGSFVFSSQRADGSVINGKPVEPLRNGLNGEIQEIIALYQYNLGMIRDVTGINEVADSSAPDTGALVGTSQIALAQADNATKELQYAFIYFAERIAKDVVLKIQDVIDNGGRIEGYYRALGEEAVRTIKLTKDSKSGKLVSLAEYGVKIEMMPDEQERQELSAMLSLEIQSGNLRSEDAIMIREQMKSNVKHAAQMLVLRKKKYQEEEMKKSQALQEQNAQTQIQSNQAAEEAKAQSDSILTQNKIAYLNEEYKLKSELSAQEHTQRLGEIALTNSGKVQVAEKNQEGNLQHTAFKTAISPKEKAA